YFNAFRFTSTLDVRGDFYWCLASDKGIGSWYILPVEGGMQGFVNYHKLTNYEFEGLDLPPTSHLLAQQLLNGQIEPGKTYLVYFDAAATEPTHSRVAARVVPPRQPYDQENRIQKILRNLGLQRLPADRPTPAEQVLTGHDNYAVALAWLPNGDLISFD